MKAVRIHQVGGPESLVYEEAPQPYAKEGEVLIRVHAVCVTPTELAWFPTWHTRTGSARPFPIILGHEFSGVIAAAGRGVTDLKVGDAVYGMNDWFEDGAEAEYCLAKSTDVATKPHSVDHMQAAAVPISALTAWQALFDRAGLSAGQRVLIHGAAGGVGSFAVQLARWRGAFVIGTASSGNVEFVRELGADEVINYSTQRFEQVAQSLDLVIDTIGGETLERSWGLLKSDGKLVTIAASSAEAVDEHVREAFFIVEPKRAQLLEIAHLIDVGMVRPIVEAEFPLAQACQGYEHAQRGGGRGKTVLRVIGNGA